VNEDQSEGFIQITNEDTPMFHHTDEGTLRKDSTLLAAEPSPHSKRYSMGGGSSHEGSQGIHG
jgi:hypothetical protein